MSLRSRLAFTTEPVYLMDGSAFIFRSFYALRTMTRADGFPTNVLFMVARLILKLLREEKPLAFAFIMDGKGPNFRHERFPAYKAQRSATPEPLVEQLEPLKELLSLLGVPVFVSEQCEADDYIASLSARFSPTRPVVIIGADKDLKQCLNANVVLWDPAARDEKITTLEDFRSETGLEPASWPDYQALVGDSSDNIPGVPKIGPKTAGELIRVFPSLEQLFDRLNAVPPKIRPKLEGQRDKAMLYRELTRLSTDACPAVGAGELAPRPAELGALLEFLGRYELRSLAREVEAMSRAGQLRPSGELPPAAPAPDKASPLCAPARGPASFDAAAPKAGGLLAGKVSGQQTVQAPQADTLPPVGRKADAPLPDGRKADAPLPDGRKAAEQGSLFAAADADTPVFTRAASLAELTPLSRRHESLALLPLEPGLLLAAADCERLYLGPLDDLAAFLEGAKTSLLVTPDYKSLYKNFPALRQLPVSRFFDLSLAAYLLSPEDRGYDFSQLAARWGETSGSARKATANPGLLALDLHRFMAGQLAGAGLEHVFSALEMPLAPVLARMEDRGVCIDRAAFDDYLAEVLGELEALTRRIHELAGRSFNIRSSQQLSDLLFSVLELPKSGKTRGGAVSTSQETLEKLIGKHPIIEAILEYRTLEKLRSTYLEPLPKLADKAGRIHTTFNQTATATGRLSSSNPNLQNIPVRGPQGVRMRGCFIAEPGGREEKALISADYSQIELRVLAHLSGDPTLLEAFRHNEDIHSRTAGLLFDLPLDQVTPDMRRNAKTINFGLIYGMGAQKLAQELAISMKEAKEFIERYFSRLTRLKEFYDSIEEEARNNGFVATMTGRRRFTPDILSQNNQLRSQARRQAINTRIQGSAADIIKLAMTSVENDPALLRLDARLLLQIHDELLLEAPRGNAQAAGKRLAEIMAEVKPGAESLSVPLLVDWGFGRSWAEAH